MTTDSTGGDSGMVDSDLANTLDTTDSMGGDSGMVDSDFDTTDSMGGDSGMVDSDLANAPDSAATLQLSLAAALVAIAPMW